VHAADCPGLSPEGRHSEIAATPAIAPNPRGAARILDHGLEALDSSCAKSPGQFCGDETRGRGSGEERTGGRGDDGKSVVEGH
jgi:hypothetical protein